MNGIHINYEKEASMRVEVELWRESIDLLNEWPLFSKTEAYAQAVCKQIWIICFLALGWIL